MSALLLSAALLLPNSTGIVRDAFGVPQVRAQSVQEAFQLAGRAVAEDRLWQMELSRRTARGQMAEVLGPRYAAADVEAFKMGYTQAELQQQFDRLDSEDRQLFINYAKGVNDTINARKQNGTLPKEYEQNGFQPKPWTVLDSIAIGVRLARIFGSFGAGELRNTLLVQYLRGQKAGPRTLDVLDDFAWFNDPKAPVTVSTADRPEPRAPLAFVGPTRAETERHLAMLPPSNLFELGGAVRMAEMEQQRLVAEASGTPFKSGSYAIVVHPSRSAAGQPMLLGAPQMGHTVPSIVHEMSIQAPGIRVTGMNLPGLPGILIGSTPDIAWTFTSGAADNADIFFSKKKSDTEYTFGKQTLPFRRDTVTIAVKGAPSQTAFRTLTRFGPVILDSRAGNAVYSQRSTSWMREIEGLEFVYRLYRAGSVREALRLSKAATVNFNFFVASRAGDIGWRFTGEIPLRARGIDPRFPTPGEPQFDWRGMIPQDKMPSVVNPASGLLSNWNNKPVKWWPNWDTPVWGRRFRYETLQKSLPLGKVSEGDIRAAIFRIARQDDSTHAAFMPMIREALKGMPQSPVEAQAARFLLSYQGERTNGSRAARVFDAVLAELRQGLFVPFTGNFLSPANLNLVTQPTLLERALRGETKFDYLDGKSAAEVVREAFRRAVARLAAQEENPMKWQFAAGGFRAPDGTTVPYSDRGTYIQLVRFSPGGWAGQSILPPGVQESGPHSADQVPLARNWTMKPMFRP